MSDKGSDNHCDGADWIRIQNTGGDVAQLAGFMLTDREGRGDVDTYTFPAGSTIAAGSSIVLCCQGRDLGTDDVQFGVHGDDVVTIWNPEGTAVDSTTLLDQGVHNYVWTRTGPSWDYVWIGPVPTTPPGVGLRLTAVADKGSTDRCEREDWIEITNTGDVAIDLDGFMLHDDKGPDDSKAFTFGAGVTIVAGATATLCKDAEGSFEFGIGGDDTVTLLDASGAEVDTSGELGNQGALNFVWTRTGTSSWDYQYQVLGTLEPTGPLPTLAPIADGTPPSATPAPATSPPTPGYVESTAAFFGDDVVPDITIELNAANWDDLAACTFTESTVRPRTAHCDYHDAVCTMSYLEYATVAPCRVRRKGTATWQSMDNKPSLKVKLEQRWRGLKRFTFNNMEQDPSGYSERLCMSLN